LSHKNSHTFPILYSFLSRTFDLLNKSTLLTWRHFLWQCCRIWSCLRIYTISLIFLMTNECSSIHTNPSFEKRNKHLVCKCIKFLSNLTPIKELGKGFTCLTTCKYSLECPFTVVMKFLKFRYSRDRYWDIVWNVCNIYTPSD
jgi:squalene cyclase